MLATQRTRIARHVRRVGAQHAGRRLVLMARDHRLLVLVVDQHLVLGVLFDVQHLLLLIAHAVVALREGAVLLVRDLLLRLLLVVLHVDLSGSDGLAFVDLRGGLAVLLDQHR